MKIKNIDPKYINVPNICFSLTSKDDAREDFFSKQRCERGFDDSETWSLVNTVASFVIPRLERFIEIDAEVTVRDSEFINNCQSVLTAFRLITRDNGSWIFTLKEERQLETGRSAFPKIFMDLWS